MATSLGIPSLIFTVLFPFIFSRKSVAAASDTVSQTKSVGDGDTLLSPNGRFALGFFSPGNSSISRRYLGIWYPFSNQTVVWVANRDNPIPDSTGVLTLTANGTLLLFHQKTNTTIWTSAATTRGVAAAKPTARLSNSGNLIVTDISGSTTWQSFDHPTDTLLPGMKVGLDLQNGSSRFLTSWKSPADPSPGLYMYGIEHAGGSYEAYVKRTDTGNISFRPGRWDGIFFGGLPPTSVYFDMFEYTFVSNENEAYYSYDAKNEATVSRLVMSLSGRIERIVWVRETRKWTTLAQTPKDDCTAYGACGPNGMCSSEGMPRDCECYDGYVPVAPELWKVKQYENGCEREERDLCGVGEEFHVVRRLKLPDTKNATVDYGKSLDECRDVCLGNCDCRAYAAADISGGGGGTGCIVWEGDLVDSWRFTDSGQDLFLRSAAQEHRERSHSKRSPIAISTAVPLGIALVITISGIVAWSTRRTNKSIKEDMKKIRDSELLSFNLASIISMTDNFANENKIGGGGFGSVYKGKLKSGEEIAVKRLSRDSGQGEREFKNEMTLIAKLQHVNLVRLLGCCIRSEEKMLIYEYMPNKSLDAFIFDPEKQHLLDWRMRFNVIQGVARGLLYLHRDSRLPIIHRDLKASNILLDKDMNPKISDFGMARIFCSNKNLQTADRVVGTFGYMSPEYGMDGLFSTKSDVYSFGVLVLEIVAGVRSTRCRSDDFHSLPGFAWKMWEEGKGLELVDPSVGELCCEVEVLRCVHVALLCVQDLAGDRPTMSTVVMLLETETEILARPKRPLFTNIKERSPNSTNIHDGFSTSSITITELDGR